MPARNKFSSRLLRILPFVRHKKKRKNPGDSDTSFRHRAEKAERKASERKRRPKVHRVIRKAAATPSKSEPIQAAYESQKPVVTKEPKKSHGVWFMRSHVDSSDDNLDAVLSQTSDKPNVQVKEENMEKSREVPAKRKQEEGIVVEQEHEEKKNVERQTASVAILELSQEPTKKVAKEKVLTKELTKEKEQKKIERPVIEEPPKEIIIRPMTRKSHGNLSRFLGSLRSFGLGKQKLALIEHLATMLNAGLPLVDSLKTLQLDMRSRSMRALLQRIVDSVENGNPLWRALDDQNCFSPDALALVRIGEEGGNLAENMAYLAAQQEKDQALRGKVKMAMIYPSIVMVLMLIVVMGLGLFVLPNLITVLYALNVELPLVTRLVIKFTEFFSQQGHIAVPSVLGGLIITVLLAKFTPLKHVAQWFMFKIPGIGRLAREATVARFGVILGGLLQAGVPLVEAMRSLTEVTPILSYRKFYIKLLEHVTVGDSFSKSFAAIRGSRKILPASVQQLVMTGERSGSLSRILLKIADIYEKKANDTAQKLPVILEPILLLFIGGLVATIAFAIIVPIYSIIGNVSQ